MNSQPVERLPPRSETWLPHGFNDEAHLGIARVAGLLPAGYECYLRVFHPFTPGEDDAVPPLDPSTPPTWRSLAEIAAATFHPEFTWETLRPVLGGREGPRPYWVSTGTLDEPARTRLFAILAAVSAEMPVFFYYGLASEMCIGHPSVYQATASAIEAVRQAVGRDTGHVDYPELDGPEYTWPEDRSWVVSTSYDLASTYIACNRALAEQLLADQGLEILPVTLTSRVDDGADLLNGTGYHQR